MNFDFHLSRISFTLWYLVTPSIQSIAVVLFLSSYSQLTPYADRYPGKKAIDTDKMRANERTTVRPTEWKKNDLMILFVFPYSSHANIVRCARCHRARIFCHSIYLLNEFRQNVAATPNTKHKHFAASLLTALSIE